MSRYVIIGNSAGGVAAVEAIRQRDREGSLTIVSEEPYPAYSRPQIGRYLAGEIGLEQILYRPRNFYTTYGAELLLGRRVLAVQPELHTVLLDDGTQIEWERLLLATGGSPIVPAVDGLEADDYTCFTTLNDAQRLKERLPRLRHVLVVGGGLIGLCVTEALCKLNVRVTIVELASQILSRALDSLAAGIMQAVMEKHGVNILTNDSLSGVHKSSNGLLCILSSGKEVLCDLIIMAIGVRPRTELAKRAGLLANRGVIVDAHMRTSNPHIYACGDAAEIYDFIAGEARPIPIWPSAYESGWVAGTNMAGGKIEHQGGTPMNALHFFHYSILSAGIVSPTETDGFTSITRSDPDRHIYRKVVLRDGRIVGFIFAGDIERAGVLYELMRRGIPIADLAETLVSPEFGLLSLPQQLKDWLLDLHTARRVQQQLERSQRWVLRSGN